MGCLLLIFCIFMPRVTMGLVLLFTNWFSQAFQTILWPVLGFILMPYTTLAWMGAMILNHHQVGGFWLIVLIVAVVVDLGGQGHYARRRR